MPLFGKVFGLGDILASDDPIFKASPSPFDALIPPEKPYSFTHGSGFDRRKEKFDTIEERDEALREHNSRQIYGWGTPKDDI